MALFKMMQYIHKILNYFFGFTQRQDYEDSFYKLLFDKNYDEALKLAQQNSFLDIDLVYKLKWRSGGITVGSINNVLVNINDKLWSINESAQTVPISYEACRRLIEFGLREANLRLLYKLGQETDLPIDDKHEGKLSKGTINRNTYVNQETAFLLPEDMSDDEIVGNIDFSSLNEKQKELCKFRQDLIRYEHSLFAYENILGNYKAAQQHFDHVFYNEFRHKTPLEACIDYARDGESHAVEIMLNFYTEDLLPHLLPIISNFPETLSPFQYRNLLPGLRGNQVVFEWKSLIGQQIRKEESDWSSRYNSTLTSKSDGKDDYEKKFYSEHHHLVKYQHTKRLKADDLSRWFIERALEMEQRTSLLTNSIQLLRLGRKANLKGLDDTHDELDEFHQIVYDILKDDDIYLKLSEFNEKPLVDRMMIMTGDSVEDCQEKFKYYVIPYIKRRESELSSEELTALFKDYFERLALTNEVLWENLMMSVNYQSIFKDVHGFLATVG